MIRNILIFTAIKRLYFAFIIISCLTVALPGQVLADSELKTVESMPGGPPIPLIAIPEDSFFRVVPSAERLSLLAQLSTFNINYLSGGTNYFGDTCTPWPAEAKDAFDYAASVWTTYLQSPVPITINACWATDLPPGVLGHSGSRNFFRNFAGAPMTNTWYAVSLANALHGSDLDPGVADMEIAYSSTFNWYLGTDGNPGPGQYDLASVVLHEIAHGLGFLGTMSVDNGQGSWGGGTPYPAVYDLFTENETGQDLIDTSVFPSPSADLATQLTGGKIYFNGTNANAANSGNRAELYAPSTWSSGSSYAHLDEIYNGTVNALMTYSIGSAEAIHEPGPITVGIFKDLGWNSSSSSCTYSIDPLNSLSFGTSGGTGSFNVVTQLGCPWTATETLDWAAITSGTSGTGSGTVTYTIASNSGGNRSGSILVSGQGFSGTHAITQAGAVTNLLQNPGFESGNTVWVQENGFYQIISRSTAQDPIPVHSGNWVAWLGGYPNANDVLYQQITISSGVGQAYVQFWYNIETEETSPTSQYDILRVEIRRNNDNSLLKTLKTFSNLDKTSGWIQSQQFDITEFKGQTVRLRFAVALDASYDTNFFIDDVTLMVTSGSSVYYVSPIVGCGGKTPCFSSIQSAIDSAETLTTINITEHTYAEDVILDNPKVLILRGGWDSTFDSQSSSTTIHDSLTITDGQLIPQDIILQ